jgi:hypothetical protein
LTGLAFRIYYESVTVFWLSVDFTALVKIQKIKVYPITGQNKEVYYWIFFFQIV